MAVQVRRVEENRDKQTTVSSKCSNECDDMCFVEWDPPVHNVVIFCSTIGPAE